MENKSCIGFLAVCGHHNDATFILGKDAHYTWRAFDGYWYSSSPCRNWGYEAHILGIDLSKRAVYKVILHSAGKITLKECHD